MPNVVGKIPEFTSDEPVVEVAGESPAQADTPEVSEEEKATPAELPAAETPAAAVEPAISVDTEELQGLKKEREKLLQEIRDLRGQRREIKQEPLVVPVKVDDSLSDLNPADVQLIDRVLKAKGLMTQEEVRQQLYETTKQEELNKFLDKYPEYKPENDPNDLNWSSFRRRLDLYKMPSDPHQLGEILEMAHQQVTKLPSERSSETARRQVRIASVGSGGTQRSSSQKSLPPNKRQALEMGGWSEEEIRDIEANLPEE